MNAVQGCVVKINSDNRAGDVWTKGNGERGR